MNELGSVVSLMEEEGSLVTNERIDDLAGRSCVVTACNGKEEKNVPERRGALLKLLEREGSHPEREGSHPEREILVMLLNHYHIFSLDECERGCVTGMEHVIDTDDYPPIQQLLHRVPFALRSKISEMVQQLVEEGIVEESSSPWSSPVVIVKKRDGVLRFCVDYHQLNTVMRKDVFTLPRIDDLLDQLTGKTVCNPGCEMGLLADQSE